MSLTNIYKKIPNKQSGFIALISTLILCAVLMMLMVTTSISSFFARSDALGSEFKRVSLGLSESCTNAALLKVAKDYHYNENFDEDPDYDDDLNGVIVEVGPDQCVIKSITCVNSPCEDPTTHNKVLKIKTQAEYPLENGSWSNNEIVATVQNPAFAPTSTVPTCAIDASPENVPTYEDITVQWAASANATSFVLIPTPSPHINNATDLPTGNRTFPAMGVGEMTFTGVAYNSAGVASEPCTDTVEVIDAGGSPICSDTIMVLDRSSSMEGEAVEKENAAAQALLDLYGTLSPAPKVGLVVFPEHLTVSLAHEPYSAKLMQGLSNNYPHLKDVMDDAFSDTGAYTNLDSAINKARLEFNANGSEDPHGNPLPRAMILLSDGDPTRADLGTLQNTGLKSPSGNSGSWQNGSGAYIDNDSSVATGLNNTEHQFSTFNLLEVMPPNSTVSGIEVLTNAYTSTLSASCKLGIRLSGFGGAFGSTEQTFNVTDNPNTTQTFGSSTDKWGQNWDVEDRLGNPKFRVLAKFSGCPSAVNFTKLDHLQVNVHYSSLPDPFAAALHSADLAKQDDIKIFGILFGTFVTNPEFLAQLVSGNVPNGTHQPGSSYQSDPSVENSDGDYLFVSPTAAQMEQVFIDIGYAACPALSPACSNHVDDDGDDKIDASDPACHTDGNAGNPSSYDPADNDEWNAPSLGPPPNPPAPPPPVSIDSWDEVIDLDP